MLEGDNYNYDDDDDDGDDDEYLRTIRMGTTSPSLPQILRLPWTEQVLLHPSRALASGSYCH